MIPERLLQYIWQNQYFNKNELRSVSGETLKIISAGQFNTSQGPDFLQAKVLIGNTILAGSIELHVLSSDWLKHAHHQDKNYSNVILHVVWLNDEKNIPIPTLSLEDRISNLLLEHYIRWMNSQTFIPCEQQLHLVPLITLHPWMNELLMERLQKKYRVIEKSLIASNYHWEEIFWWMLAKNFGIPVNADAFESVARSLPLSLLSKHKNQIHQLEALLLGQAGLLNSEFKESYPCMLEKEYQFLRKKYRLNPIAIPVHFLRMRPAGFPTVRLAQLAMLIHQSSHLFSTIKEIISIKNIRQLINITANDYWHYHFTFDESSSYHQKRLGNHMVNNIIINTLVPLLFVYGIIHKKNEYREKALIWMSETEPEKNSITTRFAKLGLTCKNAGDSQALIELKKEYCEKRKCLDCAIGNAVLKRAIS